MLPSDLKTDVLELAAIAKECPEGLKERCFELLLTHYLKQVETETTGAPVTASRTAVPAAAPPMMPPAKNGVSDAASAPDVLSDHDLTVRDVHVKARKFLEKYQKTIGDLNQILYKEGDELRPLFEDLKTTKTSESQIRIALLEALNSGIKSGEFQFDGEEVRKECQARKCYDAGNFSANFKNSAILFEGFEKYDKQSPTIRLSEQGRMALAQVIDELR
jgi:hypothetical protein